ncbi:MAG: hypothetical protein RIT43_455 [Bacteroidota bacterium]
MKWYASEINEFGLIVLRTLLFIFFLNCFASFAQQNVSGDSLLFHGFGSQFVWGVASAAYQIEGAFDQDGKGRSIWDEFAHTRGKIAGNENGDVATDFYHRYKEDIQLAKSMHFDVFRFSLSWSRILPDGSGKVNDKGIEFYHKVIDECLNQGMEPWVTLYHWDLPLELSKKGGWTNRECIEWFREYTALCAKEFGSKVKHWMIFNEPAAFVGLGYLAGYHAPGKRSLNSFLKATHYACLSMAESGRTLRSLVPDAQIGSTFSCSFVDTYNAKQKHRKAAIRLDAMLNRMFIEPSLGMGYPVKDLPLLRGIKRYMLQGDEEKLKFNFDFIGLQNYFRVVAKRSFFVPLLWAREVKATKRGVPVNEMGFEIYPEGIYKVTKQFAAYSAIKSIYITENGTCVPDSIENGQIHDEQRISFFRRYLEQVLKAKNEGVPVNGYMIWSLTDNFEWSEGYRPRFGLVYVDYKDLSRYIKDSGNWFRTNLMK